MAIGLPTGPIVVILKVLTGRGTVVASECREVRVTYRLIFEKRWYGVFAYGTVRVDPALLHPIWLQPDSVLELGNNQRLNISVTGLTGPDGVFELTGDLPDHRRLDRRYRSVVNRKGTKKRS